MSALQYHETGIRSWQIALCKSALPTQWKRASCDFWFLSTVLPQHLLLEINNMMNIDDCPQPTEQRIREMLGYGHSPEKDELLHFLSMTRRRFETPDWRQLQPTWIGDFDVALHFLSLDGSCLYHMSDQFKDNATLVRVALTNSGRCIQFASCRLRSDRLFMLQSLPTCSMTGFSIRHLSPELRDDKEIVILVLSQCIYNMEANFPFVSERLQSNFQMIRMAVEVSEDSSMIQYATSSARSDRTLMASLIPSYPCVVRYIPDLHVTSALDDIRKNDNRLMQSALQVNGHLLRHFETELGHFKWAVLAAIASGDDMLYCASDSLQNDEQVVRAAIMQCPCALQWAGNQWKDRDDFVIDCMQRNATAFAYASDRLRDDPNMVTMATTMDPCLVKHTISLEKYRGNAAFMHALIRKEPRVLHYLSSSLRKDVVFLCQLWREKLLNTQELYDLASNDIHVELAFQCLAYQGRALQDMPAELKDNLEIVTAACKKAASAFCYASYRLRNDPEVVHSLCEKHNAYILRYASKRIRNNETFITEYFQRNFAKRLK